MTFDPANPPSKPWGRFQSNAIVAYRKSKNRGDDETAEELRSKPTAGEAARYARQHVVEFDPEHDEELHNTACIAVKNVYDVCRELGYDEYAEELRGFLALDAAKNRALEIANEADAEIDPMTGEFEAPDAEEEAATA